MAPFISLHPKLREKGVNALSFSDILRDIFEVFFHEIGHAKGEVIVESGHQLYLRTETD
jgi:hypothetical protein